MAYQYLDNMELEAALDKYMQKLKAANFDREEEIPVTKAYGRITSQPIHAKISSPHYNASAMDGIALRASVTFGATDTTPVFLTQDIDYICVDTGDPIPEKYDAVVMIEDVINVESVDLEKKIKLISAVAPWQNIRQIGEDLCENDMILPSNTVIEPSSIGAIMAGGVLKIKVWAQIVVGIIPTGDEIVSPKENPLEGEIIEFNSSIFSAILQKIGAIPQVYPIVPDKKDEIKKAVASACKECDLVILNAGSSAGREDYSSSVLQELGEVFVHGIAIKPGKPTILAIVNEKPVIGVPGYPVSGIIVMEKIVQKIVNRMVHRKEPTINKITAVLTRNTMSSLKHKEFVRVKLGFVGGRMVATPLNRGAAVVTSFVKADGLMEIPLNSEGFAAGSQVLVEPLKDIDTIKNAICAIGSHDPLLDMISDILKRQNSKHDLSSSHVGSMGGITAIKRKEAHIAGIHLLDEKSGEYNISYIEKYLGKGNTALIHGLFREQGFMVKPGNPLNIRSVRDLPKIRYVNRQKGSGTRILLDYLLKQSNTAASDIYGYEREEFTHMNVAAIIASGNADAGLGIFSAAKAFGLDFVPVCMEEYDFISPLEYISDSSIAEFIEILKSDEFKRQIIETGGYSIDDRIGEIKII